MITTSTTVNIHKIIRAGATTAYTTARTSLFVKHDGLQKRFTASSITNASATSSGVLKFSAVPLWGDGSYLFYITVESADDLDTSGVGLVKLATGYIKKITNVSTAVV